MNFNDFKHLSLQFTIFTPTIAFSVGPVFAKLMATFSEIFDGNPISLPLPPDAPKDIPRIILNTKDSKIKLEISESRANLFKFFSMEEKEDLDSFVNFIGLWGKFIEKYINFTNATVGRLAVVAVKGCECEDQGRVLAQHFCKPEYLIEPFNRPENFEIHVHKRYKFDSFNVNSWVRCKTGRSTTENKPLIIVEQDLNTLVENISETKFNNAEVKTFVTEALKEQKEILKKYFPE